jgi:hypothetical protein
VYVVTAVDRLHNESLVSNSVAVGTSRTEDLSSKNRLEQNAPNPFSDFTTIRYNIGESGFVRLKIFDVSGKQVADLVNEQQISGDYSVEWRPNNVASGIYIATLTTDGGFSVTRRLVYSH